MYMIATDYNEPYSLLIRASYFISCSEHAQFTSVTFIICKWRWDVDIFYFLYFYGLQRSYQLDNKVIGVRIIQFKSTTILKFCLQSYAKGRFHAHVYLQRTCHDVHEQLGTNKLTWGVIFHIQCCFCVQYFFIY